ncbi:diguanylate phosphodiesterase [Amycolatopsis antarctica]|uniref:Diguanylate phosphodiesterase n=2 Tax=Amycolatopsis antarctica TaxID=1854586 RepID=A0A263CVW3_9PSEU|nr:GAF domain-containing protein [Amycolatopsis antarctica]OZM70274.1 diguanylate phosphodiesterase [Amycolatopsis antarctica]
MDRIDDAAGNLLELLAAGASSDRLASVVAAARGLATGDGERVAIDRAGDLALRVRRTLTDHSRREAELAALFDTASDLARLRDLDAVLRSIVHRARMLLRVDMSYLSLNSDDAEATYMRVTDGSASALFQQVRLGMGEGLGGLVAQTARPYATADYPSDDRFDHTGPIDEAVTDEGLIAILGVPLSLGGTVIGVLYAGDRAGRTFTPDEVALLSSLADHAAIAIDNARLIEDTEAALAELGAANATIGAHNEAIARAQEAHDRLTNLVLAGGRVPEVAAAVAEVLGGGIAVHDADGGELATAGTGAVRQNERLLNVSRASGRAVAEGGTWTCAVSAGPELLGSITLTGRPVLADADRRLFERSGIVTALLLLLRRSAAEAEDRVRGELLVDLLNAPGRDPAALLRRGNRVGVDLAAPQVVLVLRADGVSRTRLATAAGRHGALAGVYAEQVVLLSWNGHPGEVAARVAKELGVTLGCPVTAGASGPASGPVPLAESHAEAVRCLRALIALGRVGDGAAPEDLGFVGVVLGRHADLGGFVRSTIGPVLDYDARRGTELLRTLRAYFACSGQLSKAKDVLHVHVNTVVQRLERISTLLGSDWQEPDPALEIQLALRLHTLGGLAEPAPE